MDSWYEIKTCHGVERGCRHLILDPEPIARQLQLLFDAKSQEPAVAEYAETVRFAHQRFRVAIAGCPNACSQPQIKDVGLIACACIKPEIDRNRCSGCRRCVEICKEQAVFLEKTPAVDLSKCVGCGACALHCAPGALTVCKRGWNIISGGKLGRHPRLAEEVVSCSPPEKVSAVIEPCLDNFIERNKSKKESPHEGKSK